MTVHSLHIFDRRGKTLFTKRYSSAAQQPNPQQQLSGESEEEQLAEQRKLIFGMLFSLRELIGSIAPEGEPAALHSIRTGACTLHSFETRSGLRFAMFTNNDVLASSGKGSGGGGDASVRDAMRHIYSELWVECVVRSPLYRHGELDAERTAARDASGGSSMPPIGQFDIRSTNFEKKLDLYLSSMPWFR